MFFKIPTLPFSMFIQTSFPGVMVKTMDCGIVEREFVLQSRYYVHFLANTIGKGMNPQLHTNMDCLFLSLRINT